MTQLAIMTDQDFEKAVDKVREYMSKLKFEDGFEAGSAANGLYDFIDHGDLFWGSNRPRLRRFVDKREEIGQGAYGYVYQVPTDRFKMQDLAFVSGCSNQEATSLTSRSQALCLKVTYDPIQNLEEEVGIPANRHLCSMLACFTLPCGSKAVNFSLSPFLTGMKSGKELYEYDGGGDYTEFDLTSESLCEAMTNLYKGLFHLHERGYTHGDVKPANVMINPQNGDALLIDFGLTSKLPSDANVVAFKDESWPPKFAKGWWSDPDNENNIDPDPDGTSPSKKLARAGLMGSNICVGKPADVFLVSASVMHNLLLKVPTMKDTEPPQYWKEALENMTPQSKAIISKAKDRRFVTDDNDLLFFTQFKHILQDRFSGHGSWVAFFFPDMCKNEDGHLAAIYEAMDIATKAKLGDRESAQAVLKKLTDLKSQSLKSGRSSEQSTSEKPVTEGLTKKQRTLPRPLGRCAS